MKSICALCRQARVVLALFIALCAAPLQASVPPVVAPQAAQADHLQVRILKVQKREISREQAAALVKRRYGGKILAVSETSRKGRPAYRVKGLSDKSQVYVVYVDKQSGRIMR
ncbi:MULTISPECIES: PepSY domain-containing protein [Microbulbifer]|uniref:PepSY domain-containing protein n=1 Tax=Microbulbifer TaxID=48073 RepID=UPI001E43CE71|nr:PepSY domain-containing protein [Microbulbifer sp. YPW16]UHQ55041.1 PepSY domain-containing protein [Microbulbifer sp. YPW16]